MNWKNRSLRQSNTRREAGRTNRHYRGGQARFNGRGSRKKSQPVVLLFFMCHYDLKISSI